MSDHTTWAIERQKATQLFGGTTPYATDDHDIAAVFAQHPAQVLAEIARIADAYTQGKVHTPWRALHSRLERIRADAQPVSLSNDSRVRLAETWIRNAGLYCPTEADAADALFSPSGLLAGQDATHGDRMRALWRTEQPRAQQSAIDLEKRAARWKQGQEALAQINDRADALALSLREGEPEPFDHSEETA